MNMYVNGRWDMYDRLLVDELLEVKTSCTHKKLKQTCTAGSDEEAK